MSDPSIDPPSENFEDPFEASRDLYEFQLKASGKSTPFIERMPTDRKESPDYSKTIEFKKKPLQLDDTINEEQRIFGQPSSDKTIRSGTKMQFFNLGANGESEKPEVLPSERSIPTSQINSLREPMPRLSSVQHFAEADAQEKDSTTFGFLKKERRAHQLRNLLNSGFRRQSNLQISKKTSPHPEAADSKGTERKTSPFVVPKENALRKASTESENLNDLIESPDLPIEADMSKNAAPWHESVTFNNLNVGFLDKYSLKDVPTSEHYSKIYATKAKKTFWSDLKTISQFRLECEEKRNEDIHRIATRTSLNGKSEENSKWGFRNIFSSLGGYMRKPKITRHFAISALSPCGNYLAIVSGENDVVVFFLNAGADSKIINPNNVFHLPKRETTKMVLDLSWSCDSTFLAGIYLDSRWLQIWDIKNPKAEIGFEHEQVLTAVRFHTISPAHVLTGSLDKIVRLWSLKSNQVIKWNQTGHLITHIQCAPSGNQFFVGTADGKIAIYESSDQIKIVTEFTLKHVPYKTKEPKCDDDEELDESELARRNKKKKRRMTPKETKGGRGLFGILFKKRSLHHKITQIKFVSDRDSEFIVLTYSGKLKLLTRDPELAVCESYKQPKNTIPITFDFHQGKLFLNSEFGAVDMWRRGNKYYPVFNPNIFNINQNSNEGVESYVPFKDKDARDFFVSRFLANSFVERYNEANPAGKVQFIMVSVSCLGDIKVDCKPVE